MTDSNKRSKKSKRTNKTKRNDQTVNEASPRASPRDQMERVPSNAPTMAIAPSDYEHIFHEAPAQPSPPAAQAAQFPTLNARQPRVAGPSSPAPMMPPLPLPTIRQPAAEYEANYAPPPAQQQFGRHQYALEVQATPDGYTMLGHLPDQSPGRRVALPPHIVRAGNQFSRAALARVSRYLASRAEAGAR